MEVYEITVHAYFNVWDHKDGTPIEVTEMVAFTLTSCHEDILSACKHAQNLNIDNFEIITIHLA